MLDVFPIPKMRFLAPFKIAARALRRNKMRSLLTMLGIIIGVGSVIAAVSITTGATKQVEDKVASLGQNVVTVFSGSFNGGGMRGGWGSAPTLTVEDTLAIKNEVANVVAVSPEVRDRSQILANGLNWNTQILGESPDYPQIRDWDIASGAMFTDADVRSIAKVAVIGKTIVDQVFINEDPVGQTLIVRNIPFKIVGVLEAKGFNLFGQDQDDVVIIPYTSHMRRITKRTFVNSIMVQAASKETINSVVADITTLMRDRHHTPEPDFTVRSQLELMQMATSTAKIMSVLLAAIASVSLLVGGIGIMNIMLVSVTERTREIGIRMAVGARSRDIMIQFLIEAVLLGTIGGVLGILLGVSAPKILKLIASICDALKIHNDALAAIANGPTLVSPTVICIAFFFSALIGIMSGFYPAWKASRLDPIEALRYE
jgi:putative ABC transport system permease protein